MRNNSNKDNQKIDLLGEIKSAKCVQLSED